MSLVPLSKEPMDQDNLGRRLKTFEKELKNVTHRSDQYDEKILQVRTL